MRRRRRRCFQFPTSSFDPSAKPVTHTNADAYSHPDTYSDSDPNSHTFPNVEFQYP
ncbi:hypothetical protein GCM10022213_12000 [Parerythrobacter jejuensis]